MDSASLTQFYLPHHTGGLFRSPAWLMAWRRHWASGTSLKPLSTGRAPAEFYRFWSLKRSVLPIRTLIPAGVSSSVARSARCEYFTLPNRQGSMEDSAVLYLKHAMRRSWDVLKIPDLLDKSPTYNALVYAANTLGLYCSKEDCDTAYAVDCRHGDFSDYLSGLGKNTRLRLYNRRKKIESSGRLQITNLWPDQHSFFALLNGFHHKRWGKPCFRGRNLAFMNTLLTEMDKAGAHIDLSVMQFDNKPVSCLLDITANGRCHNFQAGFEEHFMKGVSLGTLHLGYQIESAFQRRTEFYDFMAGAGKNAHYKAALANTQWNLVSLELVRSPVFKLLYKIRDNHQAASPAYASDGH